MCNSLRAVLVCLGMTVLGADARLMAAEPDAGVAAKPPALADAWRQWEVADLRLREYAQVEYPLMLRRLDNQIQLTAAELEACERQLQAWGPSSNFRYSKAFSHTLERARLGALETKLKLEELREQRFLLQKHRPDRLRLLELELQAAAERVIELRKTLAQ